MENIILVNKPKGITSFDVIRILRRNIGKIKMGHSGTLDPLATGLMIIGLGKGTKKLKELIGLPKTYITEILLGKKTDTGDVSGNIIEESSVVSNIDKNILINHLNEMIGEIKLKVPMYSSIKIKGKPLYKHARQKRKVDVPEKLMKIFSAKLIKFENQIATVEFHVSSGTYIRSLAEELGKRINTPATVNNLHRIKIGDFDVSQAMSIDIGR